ncbi:uncharacterized protein PWA37_002627 [Arxiozyma heterogenica]|uniref:uncharacterized protein n=1 Tax=Arxiozyma heterogenica TaxID=278026 RepID=UPI002EEE9879
MVYSCSNTSTNTTSNTNITNTGTNVSISTGKNNTARDEATHKLYHNGLPIALVTVVEKEKFHGREVNRNVNSICRVVEILDSCPRDVPLVVEYPKNKYRYVHELLPGLLVVWQRKDVREI